MNFFKTCFEPVKNPGLSEINLYEKQESPHKKLEQSDLMEVEVMENKQSDVAIANKLEIRGGWHHRREGVDYRSLAYRQ